jgi:16S rRNA (cytidine1402-2'-O)-methyltransferase
MGTLYLVSTPIGNLDDLSLRAARVLGEADLVLAEDTRRTSILLRHLSLKVPLRSFHLHNEEAERDGVLERLDRGEDVALVSDAGTPLVSDPGERLVSSALAAGHRVVPIPGPSAVLAALVASGLPATRFAFLGFPPRKGVARRDFLQRVASASETVVLFEAPLRTGRLLSDLAQVCGVGREAAVARELTKLHEEIRRGTLAELSRYYEEDPPRGEVTLVVGPSTEDESGADVDEAAVEALASALLEEGRSPSRAAREVSRRLGLPRNLVYTIVQRLSRGSDDSSPAAGDHEPASNPPSR